LTFISISSTLKFKDKQVFAMVKEFSVRTSQQVEFVKITSQIQKLVDENGIKDGFCVAYVPHTTAGITINEGADPDVVRDMIMELNKIVPFEDGSFHGEGNSAAHIKASLVGSSVTVFIQNAKLVLGTWQSVFFCEFDGPRTRRVLVQIS
jgi:secondary thiamine-phosphate synthase enzyme